ncbi:hypothetical protein [Motilimonas eburnea]|uniref:hypothetical protein n=1 Tax=Motilimonas eburnea TaxID=1737488 RepID=UPI001E3E8EBE|nr:hypothetical protein [Motilimonas eburnea]MCE2570863.1 hypothetical protein [Motilimonas eburnea]
MYSDDDVNSAVAAGIFNNETARAFREHVAQRQHSAHADEEQFRLVTGFNDIFVVIACCLLLVSANYIAAQFAAGLGPFVVAILAWGLSEFFIRKRRMALPAIVLMFCFVLGAARATFDWLPMLGLPNDLDLLGAGALHHMALYVALNVAITCLVTAFCAWLHWRRFAVPITIAAITASLVALVLSLILGFFPKAHALWLLLLLLSGLGVFAFALYWDSTDPLRETRRADVAFWLHLLAAPLMVHPVFALLGTFDGMSEQSQPFIIIAVYLFIGFVSLAIDRRALMVSALGYVIYALSNLLSNQGGISTGFATTALLIGAGLLLLSAFWAPCRHMALLMFPRAWCDKLPPLRSKHID